MIVAITLNQLGVEVYKVAGEEKVISRGHRKGISHEGTGVDGEGARHASGDTIKGHKISLTASC